MAASAAPRATGQCFDKIVETLERLEEDQTLLVQSGKPVGVFRTHKDAPRVLIANSNLVPKWANWEVFNELDRKGLMMYGQMTAGSWIYIGTQGIVQGTYETFAEMGRQHYGGDLKGRWILTAGLGGMGGAQPLAAVMAGAHCIAIEVPGKPDREAARDALSRPPRDQHRRGAGDHPHRDRADQRRPARQCRGDPARDAEARHPARRADRPDLAHDPANGYCPAGWSVAKWQEMRERDPTAVAEAARDLDRPPCRGDARLSRRWAFRPSITATTSARKRRTWASPTPSISPASSRPTSARSSAAASARSAGRRCRGDPEDIYRTDQRVKELIPDDPHLHRWLDMARERIAFQGLPARICWVGLGQRHRLGLAFNEMVRNGEVSAPIVIGRDHLDSGSVASPNRETESMKDGSDVVTDWPLLNALLNTASGATWVSLHHGGGVGMGYSQHAGMVIVADGTDDAARRLERVLWNDPGTGVMRHADAGYEIAIDCAREQGLDLPMVSA